MTHKIELLKTERACGHNTKCHEEGDKRRLIYDYRIIIDGEFRACLWRIGHFYELKDADSNIIPRNPARPLSQYYNPPIQLASKADFLPSIEKWIASGAIPTLAQMAENRAIKEDNKRRAIVAIKARADREYIEQLGPELLAMLERVLETSVVPEHVKSLADALVYAARHREESNYEIASNANYKDGETV